MPGSYGVILAIFPPLLIAIALVREKEQGTILQLYASSLSAFELLMGKSLAYRTHLISFRMILGFEVSRYSALNDRACLAKPFSSRKRRNPSSCKASDSRIRSQMGSIEQESSRGEQNPRLLSVGCSEPFRAHVNGQSHALVG